MTLDDARQISEIFSSLAMPIGMIVVTVMQVINFLRAERIAADVKKIELSTNSLMDRQRLADHAAGVLEERERIKSQ